MPEPDLSSVMLEARRVLSAGLGLDDGSAMIEARILAATALGRSSQEIFAVEHRPAPAGFMPKFDLLLGRRLEHVPIAYITGRREFYGIDLNVSEATLVPRPETELLVDKVLDLAPRGTGFSVADLGTGCGAVTVAIAINRPDSRIVASDVDPGALRVAERNVGKFALRNVELRHSDWLGSYPDGEQYDFIVANPPYLTTKEVRNRQGDIIHESEISLDGGEDGLDALRSIARSAGRHLAPEGRLIVEHGYRQGVEVRNIFETEGLAGGKTFSDLAGLPRVTVGQKPAEA